MPGLAIVSTWFDGHILPWVVFNIVVVVLLVLDLKVFHRHAHVIGIREALGWSVFWISLAMLFMLPLYWFYDTHFDAALAAQAPVKIEHREIGQLTGGQAVLLYLGGYVIEKSLSVDNLFVFLLIFNFFKVPAAYQHRELFWGILGAVLMRAAFILVGGALVHKFHAILYIFGAFLVFTGLRMAFKKDEDEGHLEKNWVIRLTRKWIRVTPDFVNDHLFVKQSGKWIATPLFIVLLVIETTDVAFATDSIPAIFGITQDLFIVYSSNIFAILGLRALYFALAGMMEVFHLLHYGLAAILVFIGAKMILELGAFGVHYDVPILASLAVIALILVASVLLSMMFPKKHPAKEDESGTD